LATIGTGDVLAGMIAALRARGVDSINSAVTAAYLHGVTGAEIRLRGAITASDLADAVGRYAW
jgi:NAD(P)H-hydrate epimerase